MRKKVGKLGERAFALLCEQAGFTPHQPDEDRFGWDFLVEDPGDISRHGGLLDTVPAPLEFRVQVKSTDGSSGDVSISLAHMHRLANLQMPVFFCLLAFDGGENPVRVYLIHLGEELIARTLARVRELSAAGDPEHHKHTLSIRHDASDQLDAPFHKGLKDRVTVHVPDGISAYLVWKNKILASAGYDETRITADITFEPMKLADVVDFFLGIRDEVKLERIHTLEHRFGIAHEIQPNHKGPATLSITDHHPRDDGIISIRKDAFSPAIDFPAKWFCPPSAMNLPEDEFKLRFVTPMIELLVWPYAGKIRFRTIAAEADEHPLEQLTDFAVAIHWLSDPQGPACRIEIKLAGHSLLTGALKINSGSGDWSEPASVTAAALGLARRANIAPRVRTSLAELIHHKSALMGINGLADGAPAKVEFTSPSDYFPDCRSGFIKVFCIPVGAFRLVGVFAVVGQASTDGTTFSLKTKDVRFIRVFSMPVTDPWGSDVEASLINLASDVLRAEDIIPVAA